MASCISLEYDPEKALLEQGFIHLRAPALQDIARWFDADWVNFAESWSRLGEDRYMADGGRYRQRRHVVFKGDDYGYVRQPQQPHYQSRDYNPLNGDVQRWFEPVEAEIADSGVLRSLLRSLTPLFANLDRLTDAIPWRIEMHQFRIETSPAEIGRPTPEGLHRDGVDWVLVMLVARQNVDEGVTEIGDTEGKSLGRFTLRHPGDAVLLDDRRIRHGVTPIQAVVPDERAYRDVLVLTWKSPPTPIYL